jgi:hypothetical protein
VDSSAIAAGCQRARGAGQARSRWPLTSTRPPRAGATRRIPVDPPRDKVDSPRRAVVPPRGKVDSPRGAVVSPRSRVDSPRNKCDARRCKVVSPRDKVVSRRDKVDSPRNKVASSRDRVVLPRDKVASLRNKPEWPRMGTNGHASSRTGRQPRRLSARIGDPRRQLGAKLPRAMRTSNGSSTQRCIATGQASDSSCHPLSASPSRLTKSDMSDVIWPSAPT